MLFIFCMCTASLKDFHYNTELDQNVLKKPGICSVVIQIKQH